jgi:hypothetical protein
MNATMRNIRFEYLLAVVRIKMYFRDKLTRNIAWMLPRRLVMWCGYRILAEATSGQWSSETPTEVKMWDALGRWGD